MGKTLRRRADLEGLFAVSVSAENNTPKKIIRETILSAPKSMPVKLALDRPLLIYSRYDLNGMLLDRAERAGAQIEKTRVLAWSAPVAGGGCAPNPATLQADYCVVATGARNPLRDFGTELTARDTMAALGYYVPGDRHQIDIQFLPRLEGYIWVFPRCGHLSVGICGKGEPAADLRARLERYMDEQGLSKEGATFYSHLLPCLDTPAWKQNRVAGDGWTGGGRCRGAGGSHHRRRTLLRDPFRRSGHSGDSVGSAGRPWPAYRGCCGAISWTIWSSDRVLPAGLPWEVSCGDR